MKATGTRVAVLFAVGALSLSACSSGDGGSKESKETGKPQANTSLVSIGTAQESTGPAVEVPGAKKGGTATVFNRRDFAHLDPMRAYVSDQSSIAELIGRRLTYFKKEGDKTILVGDLATDAGTTTDGGKTWKYTLKDNLKYEDGTPIVAADIKYGVERSFHKPYGQGPKWIQSWLAGKETYWETYEGPYNGQSLPNDKIEVPNEKTIIFKLATPRGDFPFAAAMGTTAPVPKAKDTKDEYDKKPFASGPYKISEHTADKSLTLVRNENWDPKTDAIRHQYVDQFKLELGIAAPQQFQRLTNAAGSDVNATTLGQRPDAAFANEINTNPNLKGRVTDEVGPYTGRFDINNKRIPDKQVRLAILTGFPRQSARLAEGGPTAGDFATTLGSPTQLGWAKYPSILDTIPPDGDQAKAKTILESAGKLNQELMFCYDTTPMQQERSLPIVKSLKEAGFNVQTKQISDKEYYDVIGKLDTPCDLFWAGWGADWPTGATVYTPVWDGRKIVDDGENYSQFKNDGISAEIDKALAMTDVTAQGAEFMRLDKKILEEIPGVPYVFQRHRLAYGPGIGGVEKLDVHANINLQNLFIK